MAYAEKTKVPITQSKWDIEKTVRKYGADNFGIIDISGTIKIVFTINERNILFSMETPEDPKEARSIWRAMLITIKAKLESTERGIESFEEAFLAQIVAPDGKTYGHHMIPAIGSDYHNKSVPLLPNFNKE